MSSAAELEYLRTQNARKRANLSGGTQVLGQGGDAIGNVSTSLWSTPQTQQQTSRNDLENGQWYEKAFGFIDEMAAQFGAGFVRGWEGMLDLAATGLGALGDATGWYDSTPFTDWAKQDLGGEAARYFKTYFSPFNNIKNAFTGAYGKGDYWNGFWQGLLDVATLGNFKRDETYEDDVKRYYGFNDRLENPAEQFLGNAAQSIGFMMPSILTGGAAAGASNSATIAKAASLGQMGLAAAGKSGEEAMNDGASAGKALAYGAVKGGIEVVSEIVVGKALEGLASKLGLSELAKGFGKVNGVSFSKELVGKASAKQLMATMFEEGMEEVFSDIFAPYAEAIYKSDGDLWKYVGERKSDPQYWKDMAESFISGAFVGGLSSGVQTATNYKSYGKEGVAFMENAQELRELNTDYREAQLAGENTTEIEKKAKTIVETMQAQLEEMMNSTDPKVRQHLRNMMNAYSKATSETAKELMKNKASKAEIEALYDTQASRFIENISTPLYEAFTNDVQETLNKQGAKTKIRWATDAEIQDIARNADSNYEEGYDIEGFYDKGADVVYLNRSHANEVGRLIKHEAISHAILDSNEGIRNELSKYIESNAKLKKAFHEFDAELEKNYSKSVLDSERMARFLESQLKNTKAFARLFGNLTGIKGLLNKIKANLNKFRGIDAKIAEQVNKALQAINEANTEKTASGKPAVAYKTTAPTSNPDIRYSRKRAGSDAVDSDGETLSVGQNEYFKDSKFRDEDGNLMRLYHGSDFAGFMQFNPYEEERDIARTIFLTDDFERASSYTKTLNPVVTQSFDTADELINWFYDAGDEQLNLTNIEGVSYDVGEISGNEGAMNQARKNLDSYNRILQSNQATEEVKEKIKANRDKLEAIVDGKATGYYLSGYDGSSGETNYWIYLDETQFVQGALEDLQTDQNHDAYYEQEKYEDGEVERKTNNVYALYANSTNPLIVNCRGRNFCDIPFRGEITSTDALVKFAHDNGYDGVIFKNVVDNGAGDFFNDLGAGDVYAVFDSNQVKAVDNLEPTGNPDIRYSRKISDISVSEETGEYNTEDLKEIWDNTEAVSKNPDSDFYHQPILINWTALYGASTADDSDFFDQFGFGNYYDIAVDGSSAGKKQRVATAIVYSENPIYADEFFDKVSASDIMDSLFPFEELKIASYKKVNSILETSKTAQEAIDQLRELYNKEVGYDNSYFAADLLFDYLGYDCYIDESKGIVALSPGGAKLYVIDNERYEEWKRGEPLGNLGELRRRERKAAFPSIDYLRARFTGETSRGIDSTLAEEEYLSLIRRHIDETTVEIQYSTENGELATYHAVKHQYWTRRLKAVAEVLRGFGCKMYFVLETQHVRSLSNDENAVGVASKKLGFIEITPSEGMNIEGIARHELNHIIFGNIPSDIKTNLLDKLEAKLKTADDLDMFFSSFEFRWSSYKRDENLHTRLLEELACEVYSESFVMKDRKFQREFIRDVNTALGTASVVGEQQDRAIRYSRKKASTFKTLDTTKDVLLTSATFIEDLVNTQYLGGTASSIRLVYPKNFQDFSSVALSAINTSEDYAAQGSAIVDAMMSASLEEGNVKLGKVGDILLPNDVKRIKNIVTDFIKTEPSTPARDQAEKKLRVALEKAIGTKNEYGDRINSVRMISKLRERVRNRIKRDYQITDDAIARDGLDALLKPFRNLKATEKGYSAKDFRADVLEAMNWYTEENVVQKNKWPGLPYLPEIYQKLSDLYDSLGEPVKQKSRTIYGSLTSESLGLAKEAMQMISEASRIAVQTNATRVQPIANASYQTVSNMKYGASVSLIAKLARMYKRGFAPAYIVLRQVLGGNSPLAQLLTTDVQLAKNNEQTYIGLYHDAINEKLKELKIAKTLDKTVKINSKTLTVDQAISLYISLNVEANRKAIEKDGAQYLDENGRVADLSQPGEADMLKAEVGNALSDAQKQFGDWLLELMNGQVKKDYTAWYETRFGKFQHRNEMGKVGEKAYWMLNRSYQKASNITKAYHNPDALFSHAKSRVNNQNEVLIGGALSGVTAYIDKLGREIYTAPVYQEAIKALNTKTANGDSVMELLAKKVNAKDLDYLKRTMDDIMGALKDNADVFSKIMSRFTVAKLSLNIGTMLKQWASIWTSNIPLRQSTKAFFGRMFDGEARKEFKVLVDGIRNADGSWDIQPIGGLRYRASGSAAINAETGGLSGLAKTIADKGMIGITAVDYFTVGTGAYALMYIAKSQYGYDIGSRQNIEFVKDNWAEFELSQIGNGALSKNAVSRGDYNSLARVVFGFMQGANRAALGSQLNKIGLFTRNAKLNKQDVKDAYEKAKNDVQNFEDNHKTNGTFDVAALSDAERDQYIGLKTIEASAQSAWKDYRAFEVAGGKTIPLNLVGGLVLQGVFVAMVTELMRHIKGKKDWDDWDFLEIIKNILMAIGVDWLPMANAVSSVMQGYEVTIPAVDMFERFGDIFQAAIKGNARTALREVAFLAGEAVGVPTQTIFDYAYGIVKTFDPEKAIKLRSIFYAVTKTEEMKVYDKVYESTDAPLSDEAYQEVLNLYKQGLNPLPSAIPSQYEDSNGKQITVSWTQQQNAKKFYSRANAIVASAIKSSEYRSMTNEQRAALIRSIYNAYRSAALSKSIANYSGSMNKLALLAKTGNNSLANLFSAVSAIRGLEATATKTRKQLAIEYVNRLPMGRNDRLLVLALAGFSVDSKAVRSALASKGMSQSDIKAFLG